MRNLIAHPLVRWGAGIAWTILITVLLLQSSGDPAVGPASPPGPPSMRRELELTMGHIIGFSVFTLVWWWVLYLYLPLTKAIIIAVICSIAYGIFTEYMQISISDRNASLYDIAVNTLVTLAIALLIYRVDEKWSHNDT